MTIRTSAALVLLVGLAGCSEDSTGPADQANRPDSLVLNSVSTWAYASITGSTGQTLTVSDATTSPAWDIGVFGTSVMLNGGGAGPGGVSGYCICGNGGLTDAQVGALRGPDGLTAFEAVTAAQIPSADSLWKSDVLSPAITGWYSYDIATHQVSAAADRSFYVRTADGNAFAKLRVIALANATQATPGRVTFEYALQASKGAAIGPVQTATVEVPATGRVHFDLNTGAVTESGWDVAFQGFTIRVNGGVSGSGAAGAIPVTTEFGSITDPSEPPATVFRADVYGGVFEAKKWYRYNITGTDHQIWPTYDVYLVKRGSAVYKVQLVNYYNASGESRHVTFRYAKIAG